jgi:maleate isomerase
MNRRHFISVVSAGAAESSLLREYPAASIQGTKWQPDGAATLARVGVLTPAFDPVPESEMWAMAPAGVSIHASRVPRDPETQGARAFAEPPNVDWAVEQVATLSPRVILYAFTSSSYILGPQADDSLRMRLEKQAGGVPVLLTCPAAKEALQILGAHKVAVIHPPWFTEEVNAQGLDYFRTQGFEVVLCARITPLRRFTEVPPAEVYEWVRANVPRSAEAVFIGGNGLRAIGAIRSLEEALRRPVLTANQVLFWRALRMVRVTAKVTRYGRLFTTDKSAG